MLYIVAGLAFGLGREGHKVTRPHETGHVASGPPAKDHQVHQRVGAEPVGAMDRDAGALAGSVESGERLAVRVDDHAAIEIGGNAAHGIVGGGLHGHGLDGGVDAQVGAAEVGDIRQLGLHQLAAEMAGIEVHIVLAIDAAACAHFEVDGPRHDVARRQIEESGRVALHKALPVTIQEDAALAAHRLGDEDAHLVDAGGVKLEKLQVLQGHAAPQGDGRPIPGQGMGIGRDLEHAAHTPGGKEDRLGAEGVDLAGEDLIGYHATGGSILDQQVEDVVLVKELHVVAHTLLVERLEDHVAGVVGRIAGAAHRSLAKVVGVAAKGPLGDPAVRGAVEGQPPVLQLVYRLDGLLGHRLGCVLIDQVVAAFDRIKGMPLPQVFLAVAQGRANATLRRARVGPGGIELAEDRHAADLAQFQGCPQSRAASTDDDRIKRVIHSDCLADQLRGHGSPEVRRILRTKPRQSMSYDLKVKMI